jgi:four helix bundle protein
MNETVRTFEDLIAWQKARTLARRVYEVTREEHCMRDFGFCGQIQRAAVSIVSNIAEGHERGGSAEFAHFLSIAKASCAELRAQLYIAIDIGYIDEQTFTELMQLANDVARLLGALRTAILKRARA